MKIEYICKRCTKKFIDHSWQKRIFCSRGCRSKSLQSSIKEKAYNWKGDKVGYNSLHAWVRRNFGKAKKCAKCNLIGKRNGRNWNIDWANISGKYSRDKSDWNGLCRKCHAKFDKEHCKNTIYLGNNKTILKHEL